MGLDERGDIAILEIIVYTPILVSSGFLIFRHGLTRNAGWIFLLILSIGKSSSRRANPHINLYTL